MRGGHVVSSGRSGTRVNQAVILAGGRGTRLGALTDERPKPMIEVHGKPFIAYVLEMLRAQGIKRVLFLLGYRAEAVIEHFGDGSEFGVAIDYSVSSADDETGTRLRRVRNRVDETFLLTYCDNYWPVGLDAQTAAFARSGCSGLLTVYRNRDGYTRDNVAVVGDRIVLYDKARTAPGLAGVDIGYGIFDRSILERIPSGNPSFEATVYPQLVDAGALAAYETDHRYYSIGSPSRLGPTQAFLRRDKMVLLDRDGTLNVRKPPGEYVTAWEEWQWIPGVLRALERLHARGYRCAVITNQPGIARGSVTWDALDRIHERMCDDVRAAGGRIDAVFVCPHGWDDGCECRKPQPGLLLEAQRRFDLDLTRTPFIGDDERDAVAAQRARSPFFGVDGRHTLADVVDVICKGEPSFASAS